MSVSARSIASKIRSLRTERRWTQAELATRLGLSQSRLSELERGDGSFTAEQFIELLRLFNVTVRDFAPERDTETDLQQALARFGAKHLLEPDTVVPIEQLADLHELVVTTLVSASSRLITALGPVVVANIDRLNLSKVLLELSAFDLENRLYWLCSNLDRALASREWSRKAQVRRCHLVLAQWVSQGAHDKKRVDILDRSIRTQKTLASVQETSSDVSKAWNIVTDIRVEDFAEALGASGVLDH